MSVETISGNVFLIICLQIFCFFDPALCFSGGLRDSVVSHIFNVRLGPVKTLLSMSSESVEQSPSHSPKHIVIAGAGVIGTSTAFYLAKHKNVASITLVDTTGTIAPAASGKAGGFLALDWNDYSSVGPLARRSFQLHSKLAEELGAEKIMYRRLTCASISVRDAPKRPSGKKLVGVEWASDLNTDPSNNELAVGYRSLGDESTIAQVHPKMLCDTMWDKVNSNEKVRTKIVKGKVESGVHDQDGKLIGAKLDDGSIISADALLYACGPWTKYGNCMLGVKYHSVIVPTPHVLTQCVFYDGFGDPEVYPRGDGTAYLCGFPDPAVKVTEEPGQEEIRQEKVDQIVDSVRAASGGLDGVLGRDPKVTQSCYLPSTPDNIPIMGEIADQKGCFVAAGHGCWGILLGPATGEAMASLIVKNTSDTVDLRPFHPGRFANRQVW